jgi:hypothetical protein
MREVSKYVGATVGCLMTYATISPISADQRNPITLLPEFRPISGIGNNLVNPNFNAIPGSPEINLAP